jgi:mRNA interferase HicA
MAALSSRAKVGICWSRRGDRTSTLPQHGGRKQLGKGLWSKILKDLGLKEN